MQPIQGAGSRPPGEPPSLPGTAGGQPLSPQQRTLLERLIVRIIALSQQQNAEVWAGLKHDLGLKSEEQLLSRHFPAAEQNLNQRLNHAQTQLATRQIIQQLSDLLPLGNNRQAVSDFIRQQFGQTALSQLTPAQLKTVLTLLQTNRLAIPQPQQRPATDRPLLPAEHHALNQQVAKLAATTGEPGKQIWQSMLELSGVKSGELIPARHFAQLTTWLQARQALSQLPAPTLHNLQAALKQPLEVPEWKEILDYSQQRFQATPQTPLSAAQVLDILNQVFLRRTGHAEEIHQQKKERQPDINPLFASFIEPLKTLSDRPGLALTVLIVVVALLWTLL